MMVRLRALATDIDYNQDYRITDIDVSDIDKIMSLTYRYNDNANITAMLDNLGVDSQEFGYDELNRLTFASGSYGDIDYTYDGVGNRLSRTISSDDTQTSESYRYEAGSHRLESVTTTNEDGIDVRTFEHDANGNTVADREGDRQLTMIVNARNRMAAIYDDGHRIGEYEYNALGQRVAKTAKYRRRSHAHFDRGSKKHHERRDKGQHNEGNDDRHSKHADKDDHKGKHGHDKHAKGHKQKSNGRLHHHEDYKPVTEHLQFQYDQWGNLIAESDHKGKVVREYIYLGNYRIAMVATGLDKPKVEPKEKEGRSAGRSRHPHRPVLYFIHNDHLGTPQKVTDADQRIVWSMSQTPFGEVGLTTEGIRMPMRFPGQYADIESGFNYNYFRDYDPTVGRYIEVDPFELNGGLNAYSYVGGNPLMYTDPRGLDPVAGHVSGVEEGGCRAPLACAGETASYPPPYENPLTTVGFVSTVSGLALATEDTVLTASGKRMSRLPLYYGMDIRSYTRATTAAKYLGRTGIITGIGAYAVGGVDYAQAIRARDYRAARKSAADAFYGALMLVPPWCITIPVGVIGLVVNNVYHNDPDNP